MNRFVTASSRPRRALVALAAFLVLPACGGLLNLAPRRSAPLFETKKVVFVDDDWHDDGDANARPPPTALQQRLEATKDEPRTTDESKCTSGDRGACRVLLSHVFAGRLLPGYERSAHEGCARGIGEACVLAGALAAREAKVSTPKGGAASCEAIGAKPVCLFQGGEALVRGDERRARRYFTRACERGSTSGCELRGYLALRDRAPVRGFVVEKNACRLGRYLFACWRLRRMGSPARIQLVRACDQRVAAACSAAATFARVERRTKVAENWLARGCELGDGQACFQLGALIEDLGQRPDEATQAYIKACAKKHPSGCTRVGRVEERERRLGSALLHYFDGCQGGSFAGCSEHRRVDAQLQGGALARARVRLRCEQGDQRACRVLLFRALQRGGKQAGVEARHSVDTACARGEWTSCALSGLVKLGYADLAGARRAVDEACRHADMLGCMLSLSLTTNRDSLADIAFFACARGSLPFCGVLTHLGIAAGAE